MGNRLKLLWVFTLRQLAHDMRHKNCWFWLKSNFTAAPLDSVVFPKEHGKSESNCQWPSQYLDISSLELFLQNKTKTNKTHNPQTSLTFFWMIVRLKRLISASPGIKLHSEKISEIWTWQIHREVRFNVTRTVMSLKNTWKKHI